MMIRILVTNDDGYRSEGLKVLADALSPLGEVTIVAPVQEASAIGHALTLRLPLRIEEIETRSFGPVSICTTSWGRVEGAAAADGGGAVEVIGRAEFASVGEFSRHAWRSRNQARWQKAKSFSSEARV